MKGKNTSKQFSMEGWNITEFLKGNKEAFKLLISVTVGIISPINPAARIVAGAIAKGLLDAMDYYLSEVEIK